MKTVKTNAMRILDKENISYKVFAYDVSDGLTDGKNVADKCSQDDEKVFKTLVCIGSDKNFYVFVIQVDKTLSLKSCAKSVDVKNMELIPLKDLTKITGYVRGGCSPIGMKKHFITVYDIDILNHDEVFVSGGKVGLQIVIKPEELIKITKGKVADIKN